MKRWSVYHKDNFRARLVEQLKESGFSVYDWKNAKRLTIEGTDAKLTLMFMKYNNGYHTFMPTQFPDPTRTTLARKL